MAHIGEMAGREDDRVLACGVTDDSEEPLCSAFSMCVGDGEELGRREERTEQDAHAKSTNAHKSNDTPTKRNKLPITSLSQLSLELNEIFISATFSCKFKLVLLAATLEKHSETALEHSTESRTATPCK